MLEERLNGLYEQYGYRKFRMSKFEDYDLYAQNKDFLKSGHIITFTDVDGALKALKPDITLSIMKNNNGSSEKVYYNENVYRDMGGTFKEILQVGVESVGQLDPYAEAEVIALAAKSLELLSEDYVLDLSDVSFVSCLLDDMALSDQVREQVLEFIAQKNAPGIQTLASQGKLTQENAQTITQLMAIYAPLRQGIDQAGQLARNNASWGRLRQLSLVASILEGFGLGAPGPSGLFPGQQHGLLRTESSSRGSFKTSPSRCSPAGGMTTVPRKIGQAGGGQSALPCTWAAWNPTSAMKSSMTPT